MNKTMLWRLGIPETDFDELSINDWLTSCSCWDFCRSFATPFRPVPDAVIENKSRSSSWQPMNIPGCSLGLWRISLQSRIPCRPGRILGDYLFPWPEGICYFGLLDIPYEILGTPRYGTVGKGLSPNANRRNKSSICSQCHHCKRFHAHDWLRWSSPIRGSIYWLRTLTHTHTHTSSLWRIILIQTKDSYGRHTSHERRFFFCARIPSRYLVLIGGQNGLTNSNKPPYFSHLSNHILKLNQTWLLRMENPS